MPSKKYKLFTNLFKKRKKTDDELPWYFFSLSAPRYYSCFSSVVIYSRPNHVFLLFEKWPYAAIYVTVYLWHPSDAQVVGWWLDWISRRSELTKRHPLHITEREDNDLNKRAPWGCQKMQTYFSWLATVSSRGTPQEDRFESYRPLPQLRAPKNFERMVHVIENW